jgi:hypothetical protein
MSGKDRIEVSQRDIGDGSNSPLRDFEQFREGGIAHRKYSAVSARNVLESAVFVPARAEDYNLHDFLYEMLFRRGAAAGPMGLCRSPKDRKHCLPERNNLMRNAGTPKTANYSNQADNLKPLRFGECDKDTRTAGIGSGS